MSLSPLKITAVRRNEIGTEIIFPSAQVAITVSVGGSYAVLKGDDAGITTVSNPFNCDSNGEKQVWIGPGDYDVSVSGGASWRVKILGSGDIRSIANVADLRNTAAQVGQEFDLVGHTTQGKGGGRFYCSAIVANNSTDNDGTIIVSLVSGVYYEFRRPQGTILYPEMFNTASDGVIDDRSKLQTLLNIELARNGVMNLGPYNYKLSAPLQISGSFRTLKIKGVGTGNSQTASSGGTAFITAGVNAIEATFNTFANENIIVEGMNFYDTTQNQLTAGSAIKIVRGASNNRYISGFRFIDVGINGYGAAFEFQGMNTANADNNFIGSTTFDRVSITGTGVGFYLKNCSLNLVTLSNTVLLDCKYGGIRIEQDGAVGAGLGKGGVFVGTLTNKTHFEGVGGMFRTLGSTVLDSLGATIRNQITLIDFTHEGCATTTGPAAGEPYVLGVNTDIHIIGDVVDGLSFGEVSLPSIGPSNRIWSTKRVRVIPNTGMIMTPKTINAPALFQTITNGNSGVFTLPVNDALPYAIRSILILAGGQAGFAESMHYGISGGAPTRVQIAQSVGAGVTLTWAAASGVNMIQLTVANATGFTLTARLDVENLTSSYINTASQI